MKTGRTLAVMALVALAAAPGIVLRAQRAQPNAVSNADAEVLLQAAMHKEQVEGRLPEAIDAYKAVVAKAGSNKRVAAKALLQLAASYEKLGRPEARTTYQAIVRDYPDQPTAVATARARLGAVGSARGQEEFPPRRVLDGGPVEMIEVSEDGRLALGREIAGLNYLNLAVRDLSSGRTATLLKGTPSASWFRPRLSSDGRRVAYRWLERTSGREPQMSLRVIGTEPGATPDIILPQVSLTTNPMGWSPDAKAILVSVTPQELAWLSVESKSVRTVKTFEKWQEVYDASVSPDGRFIAYSAKPVSGSNDKYIYIMDANGLRETAVVKTAGSRGWPFWRPDGTQLFFRGDRGIPGGSALWSIGIRDGEAVGEPWIVKEGFTEIPIGFTSSGSLFYTRSSGANHPYQFLIHRNPAQGESALAFTGQAASWSPDGRSLAFMRGNATGALELIIRSVDTGEERSYRHAGIPLVTPRWLHNGSGLIVMINAQVDGRQTSAFHLMDVRTGTFRRLFDRDANGRSRTVVGTVSPDDRTLYLGVRNAAGRLTEIVGVDLATGVERPIFTLPGAGLTGGIGLAVSPDGATLAWMASGTAPSTEHADARIYSVGVDGSNYREVFGPFPTGAGNMIADKMQWTPDGRTIVFVDFDANNNWRLMRVPAEGGKAEFDGLDFGTLAPRAPGVRMVPGSLPNLDLSPDGSRALVCTHTVSNHELWALDNLPSVANSR